MDEKINLCDGKYTVVLIDQGRGCKALRYGEEWRDLSGDNIIVAMFSRIQELEEKASSSYKEGYSDGQNSNDMWVDW